jgi:superfamily II DNA helicase RecQ
VLVISHINAIMMDQCNRLAKKNILACYIDYTCTKAMSSATPTARAGPGSTSVSEAEPSFDLKFDFDSDSSNEGEMEAEGEVLCGISLEDVPTHQLIYAHPETFTCSKAAELIGPLQKKICAIAVDEAHIVLEW